MRKITDDDIYSHYLGELTVGLLYNSPIPGRDDNTPSFCVYEKDGMLLWKDFGLSDPFGNRSVNLVQHLRGLPPTPQGYYKAVEMIRSEVGMSVAGKALTQLRRKTSSSTTPYIKGRIDWEPWEVSFWNRFDIPPSFLIKEWVQPLECLSWKGTVGSCDVKSRPDDPAFIYWHNKSPASWKVHRVVAPKKFKFRQDNIQGVIEGWGPMKEQFTGKKFKILFVNSSSKDRFVVKYSFKDLSSYNAINPKGETDRMEIMKRRDEIMMLADRVIILYDADTPGYNGALKLHECTGFEYYDVRGLLEGEKDFSDYVDKEKGGKSLTELRDLIMNIIT